MSLTSRRGNNETLTTTVDDQCASYGSPQTKLIPYGRGRSHHEGRLGEDLRLCGDAPELAADAASRRPAAFLSSPFLSLPLELGNHLLGDAPQLAVEVSCICCAHPIFCALYFVFSDCAARAAPRACLLPRAAALFQLRGQEKSAAACLLLCSFVMLLYKVVLPACR